jgi:putative N-acetyltransferase (TIGR04045 family)
MLAQLDDVFTAPYAPAEFRIKQATLPWEFREAHALRRAVFCIEQGIFAEDDRDAVDEHAQLLVAESVIAGVPDQVVGTVRIHRESLAREDATHWRGSRLAVHAAFRSYGRLGATLIRLAVASAHAQGCTRFLAHVQTQNETLFQALHWQTLAIEDIHGRPHCLMQADLAHYPPCAQPQKGYVTLARGPRRDATTRDQR